MTRSVSSLTTHPSLSGVREVDCEHVVAGRVLSQEQTVVGGREVSSLGLSACSPSPHPGLLTVARRSVHHHDAHHPPRPGVRGRGGAHHVARLPPVAGGGDGDRSSRPGSRPPATPALRQDVQRGPEGDPVPLEEEHRGQHQDGDDGHPDGDEDGDGAEAPGGVVAQPTAPLVLVDQEPAVLRQENISTNYF